MAAAMRESYKSDLTDAQWDLIAPLIPPAKPGGRPRKTDMRQVVNTMPLPGARRLPVGSAAARPAAQEHRLGLLRRLGEEIGRAHV